MKTAEDHSALAPASEIPALLQGFKNWCRWALLPNAGGRPSKKPLCKPGDRSTFLTWDAVKDTPRNAEGGVGFHFLGGVRPFIDAQQGRLLGIDLDAVRDPVTGAIAPLAIEIIEHLNGPLGLPFTEVSPSGTGLHVIVCVEREPPAGLRSKVRLMIDAAPNTKGKTPEIQIFGLGETAGYLCMTGNRLAATEAEITCIESIDWLIDYFGLNVEERSEARLPTGEGPSPTLNAISEKVREMPHGEALIAGRWQEVTGEKSASEAYQRLIRLAVSAANGHGASVVQWLLTCTAWGRGGVEESADPMKYARESWVERDVARNNAKGAAVAPSVVAEAAFEALPPLPAALPGQAGENAIDGERRGVSPTEAFDRLVARPTRHIDTGIPALNAALGGGMPVPSRVVTNGSPDAGKTGLVTQLIDVFARSGIPCGVLAVDEDDRDLLMRLMQRRGWTREQCEACGECDEPERDQMRAQIAGLPIRFYGPEFTIEAAAADLHAFARSLGQSIAVFAADSMQTVRCEADNPASGRYEAITARVNALREAEKRYGFLVLATSEMNRGGYANPDKRVDDMAASSGSGAIEYQARVLLSLRSVPGSSDLVELRVVKNKHGPRTRDKVQGIVLRLDRARQTLTEVSDVVVPDRSTAKQTAQGRASLRDAALLAIVLLEEPGKSGAKVEASTRSAKANRNLGGLGHAGFEAARAVLGAALVDDGDEHRSRLRLDASKLTPELLAAIDQLGRSALVDATARAAVAAMSVAETEAAIAGIAASMESDKERVGIDLSGPPRSSTAGRAERPRQSTSPISPDFPAPHPGRSE